MPFVLYERGFQLPARFERRLLQTEPDLPAKREAWRKHRTTISEPVTKGM
jgi:hypothetical protein